MTTSATRPPLIRLVCLTGFMGAGKTTIGGLLARQLAWRFEDLDSLIEKDAGLTISAIFERFGEPEFRRLEREQLELTLSRASESREGIVLALGGGTYAQPGIVERLRTMGAVVVWIDCPVEQLLSRCAMMTNRPLFRDEPSFRNLLAARLPFYQQADHQIAGGDDPAKIVGSILALPPFGRWLRVGEECASQRVKP